MALSYLEMKQTFKLIQTTEVGAAKKSTFDDLISGKAVPAYGVKMK